MRKRLPPRGRLIVAAIVTLLTGPGLRALTITEVMYHPAEVESQRYEYIEIYNENPDPIDLSGFSVCDGVDFVIPQGTFLLGHSFLVICADEVAIREKYDIDNVVGDWIWQGEFGTSLSNGGERIEICNPGGRVVAEVRYNDRGKWAAAADGTGHSLELIAPYTEIDDPDSWDLSNDPGGSPGRPGVCWETSLGGGGPVGGPVGEFTGHGDVGMPCGEGETIYNGLSRRYTITGGGDDIWTAGDQFHYAWARVEGDFDISARILSRDWLADQRWGKGGIMCRQDLTASSRYVFVHDCSGSDNARLARRTDHGGSNNEEVWDTPGHPDWYRLVRSGNTITGYWSDDGGDWTAFGGVGTTTWAGGSVAYIGLALTSHAGCGTSRLTWADFEFTGDVLPEDDDGGGDGGGDPPPEGACDPREPVVINEGFFRTAGDRWIELHNAGADAIDLGGYHVTDDPGLLTKSTLAAGTEIPGGGFLSFTDVDLGLDFSVTPELNRVFVTLVRPDGVTVVDAVNFRPSHDEFGESLIPDGATEMRDGAPPTRDAANELPVETGVVINEIMYHPIDGDRDREFLELFNRGEVAIDLTGWELTNGVDFAFADGQMIGPGEYLVVARNPDLIRTIYDLDAAVVVGPQDEEGLGRYGSLRDRGERVTLQDHLGRTADTVRYHDGGEWPRWADGHGSSLELIDPLQDNRVGMSWDSSDDSAESPVVHYQYAARDKDLGDEEVHLLLLARGITVVDNVSVVAGGATVVDTELIDVGDEWRYFKGVEAPPADWADPGFDDDSWLRGPTGIGYGDGDDATELGDMQGNYLTVFCRRSFNVANPAAIDDFVLSVVVDDGFNAYLNGVFVGSFNVAGRGFADGAGPSEPTLHELDLTARKDLLVAGANVLAVSVHNTSVGSSDLSFIPRLVDRSLIQGGGAERIVNGHFNSGTSGWRIEGTHIRSGRTTVDVIDGSGSLKIIASGRGDNKVNRIETTNSGLSGALGTNDSNLVSFDAKWLIGSRTINVHAYQHAMARTLELAVPQTLGTPGAINSVTQRLIDQTGIANLGPVLTDLEHDPQIPEGGEDVTVRVRVFDIDGVSTVRIRWRRDDPAASMTAVDMSHIGDGIWEGIIPGQGTGAKVVFFIEATDAAGADARYPVDVLTRTHPLVLNTTASVHDQDYFIYRHEPATSASTFHDYRFYMTDRSESTLSGRKRLSNDLIDGTFSFAGSTIYHGSKVRFSGSPWARGSWNGSFRVVPPRDNPLHGSIRKFNLEDHHGNGRDARERIAHHLIRLNQGAIAVPYSEVQTMATWRVNARGSQVREHVWVPDTQYLGLWFDDDGGDFLEMDDRFVINDNGDRAGNTDGRVLYPPPSAGGNTDGSDKENYRWFFGLRAKNGADDFTGFLEFCRLMDPGDTSDALFDERVWETVNVEEFLRIWAIRFQQADWDTWGTNRGKNAYFYNDPSTGQWNLLPWDMELIFETGRVGQFLIPTNPNSAFSPGSFAEVNRMFSRLRIKRMYYAILDEMVNGPTAFYTSTRLRGYADLLADFGMANTGIMQPGGYIDQRRDRVRSRLGSVVNVAFNITTNAGRDFQTTEFALDFEGAGPVTVSQILVNNEAVEMAPTSMTGWRATEVPILAGVNELQFLGFNLRGELVGSDTITVTNTVDLGPPILTEVAPGIALPGVDVTLTGTGFLAGARVFFGAIESPEVTVRSETSLVARVPDGAFGAVRVRVLNPDGQESGELDFTVVEPPPEFVRGDVNGDGSVDISDSVKTLRHLFVGVAIDCEDAADIDDNEVLEVTDAVRGLDYLFQDGPAPAGPYPTSGVDPSGDALGCDR